MEAKGYKRLTVVLSRYRRRLRAAGVLRAVCMMLCGMFVWGLLVAILDKMICLREPTAALLGAGGLLLCGLAGLWFAGRAVRRWSRLEDLALEVEASHPELMDSYISAVELEQKKGPLSELEHALLWKMRQDRDQTLAGAIQDTFRRRQDCAPALLGSVVCGILLLCVMQFPAWSKCRWGLHDLRTGECSGIRLDCPSEVARGADFTVHAEILRGEPGATIDFSGADGNGTSSMHTDEDGMRFTFYGVSSPVRFRVSTPSLQTRWKTIRVYDPPVLEGIQIRVSPPSYTGREPVIWEELRDMEIVQGTSLQITPRTKDDVTTVFCLPEAESQPLPNSQPIVPQTSGRAVLVLADRARHTAELPFKLTVVPDSPPVLSVLAPTPDATCKFNESLHCQIDAEDDFGLTRLVLHWKVNGGVEQETVWEERSASQKPRPPGKLIVQTESCSQTLSKDR